MFTLTNSRPSSNLGHMGSRTRSLGQIIGKPCVHSIGHTFGPILMKLGQNVDIDEILDEFENGSCRVKN